MTTYPLSEAATVHAGGDDEAGVRGRGTLEECASLIKDLPPEDRRLVRISMDDLDLEFGPKEVVELVAFLDNEEAGLSNKDIAEIPDPDR